MEIAADRGYLGARFVAHRLELDVERNTAAVFLTFDTGPRYVMGDVDFGDNLFSFQHAPQILANGNMMVYDNGNQQEIRQFVRESDLPLRIGIVMDTSNSIRDRFRFEQEAAIELRRGPLQELLGW